MTRQRYFSIALLFSLLLPVQATPVLTDISRLIEAGQYRPALSQLDKLLAGDKHNPHYLFSRARALAGMGQVKAAIVQYQSLIKAHPSLPEPYNNLAAIYIQQGKTVEAHALLNKAMLTHPGYARVYKNLALVNASQARAAYAKALQVPIANQARGLEMADTLSFSKPQIPAEKPMPMVQTTPIVTATVESHIKPAMVYQAKTPHADKITRPLEKKQSVAGDEANAVQTLFLNWARAWSTKSVDQYLHFYSDDYSPVGMSHAVWAAQRSKRIKRPKWIRVTVRDFEVSELGAGRLRVRLEQGYAADNYRDVTRKEFILQKFTGEWRIVTERGLGYTVR